VSVPNSVSADFSAAPEIAQLATAPVLHEQGAPRSLAASLPATAGRRAGDLARLAAAPQRWWDLVRFDPAAPVRVPVPGAGGAWLLVVPPGFVTDCDCRYATLVAGEASENGRPLRPGRVLLHGAGGAHRVLGAAHGYSVTLHGL
jgi:hypothetical protein